MGFLQAIGSCFSNFFTTKGRAARSEYWYFSLFCYLINFILFIIEGQEPENLISNIIILVLCIPWICVASRRLHDINKSGWWQLIVLTIIGIIPFYYWMCKKSDESDNIYGKSFINKDRLESAIWTKNTRNSSSDYSNKVEEELFKIEDMFNRDVISKKERELMRKKILKI